jgi:hypothetical protein
VGEGDSWAHARVPHVRSFVADRWNDVGEFEFENPQSQTSVQRDDPRDCDVFHFFVTWLLAGPSSGVGHALGVSMAFTHPI